MNTAHKGKILTYMVDKADCRFLVAESRFLDRVTPVLKDLPKLEKVLVLGEPGERIPSLDKPVLDYQTVVDNSGKYEKIEVLWSDPFAIIFTSGTTGVSKGVLLPQNFAVQMGEMACVMVEYDDGDCLYNALPLFHGNAQVLSTMPALMSGARMVLGERFSASRFWDEVRLYGCTEFNFIGGIIPILLKSPPKPDDADNPLRAMMGAGVPRASFTNLKSALGSSSLKDMVPRRSERP